MGGVARPTCATSHNAVEYEYAGGSSAASLPFIQKELSNRCPVSFFGAPAAILLSAGKHQVSSIQNLHFRLTFFCVFEYFLLSKLHDPHFPSPNTLTRSGGEFHRQEDPEAGASAASSCPPTWSGPAA